MSVLDDLISGARRSQQDEQRRDLEKQARKVRRILGKDLYTLLDPQPNLYESVLEFTARGVGFYLSGPTVGWGMYVTVKEDYHRPFGRSRYVTDADDLLLFIDNNTKKERA